MSTYNFKKEDLDNPKEKAGKLAPIGNFVVKSKGTKTKELKQDWGILNKPNGHTDWGDLSKGDIKNKAINQGQRREEGEGYGTIGRALGMSRATVASIVKREKVAA